MDLKTEINNTNTKKENLKTVANKIDDKLVSLGGDRAVNIADVPNKIQSLSKSYKKMARGFINARTGSNSPITIPTNADFTIKECFLKFHCQGHENTKAYLKNGTSGYIGFDGGFYWDIQIEVQNPKNIYVWVGTSNTHINLYITEWIAIG